MREASRQIIVQRAGERDARTTFAADMRGLRAFRLPDLELIELAWRIGERRDLALERLRRNFFEFVELKLRGVV